MMNEGRLLAVIPARAGSKGLPGKNIRQFVGLPLIAHSVLFAKLCPEVDRVVVSTDSPEIAKVAETYGADVPFQRPSKLAQDDSPLWPALRHALQMVERSEGKPYEFLVLLDPTSPARLPEDLAGAFQRLKDTPRADGIIGVSRPDFNPIWHCVIERDGWMADLIEDGSRYNRRQDVPSVYRIHGSLYMWRSEFVRREETEWRKHGHYLLYETPDIRSMSIDDARQFEQGEVLVQSGLIRFPWLSS